MTRAEQISDETGLPLSDILDDLSWHTDDESEECPTWAEELRALDRAVPEPEPVSPFDGPHHNDYRREAGLAALVEYGPFGREEG